ncbi:DUF4931 domain-containing protein [Mollicutes bacterium LVI A0039]|nr:DUF4931 domain-containing protein [Mollicutes bacterium LVI A0039]
MNTIYFNRKVNNQKPSTIRNKRTLCPFCDHSQLNSILGQKDDMILVENKFSTLKDALMLVLIESDECASDMHTYSVDKLQNLLEYAISKWIELEDSGDFKSVALFKNKGLHSSGTISHPHMQIVGFKDQDVNAQITIEHLQGREVKLDDIEFNLSTLPLISFLEYNVKITDDLMQLAKTVSLIAKYVEDTYWGPEASYNFFFYNLGNQRYLKIIPRYPTSALHIGYGIVQIYDEDQLTEYVQSITEFYHKSK